MVWKIIWKPVTNFLLGFIASSWCGGNMKTIMNMDSKYYSDLNITIWDDAQIGQRGGSVTQWKKQETNYMFQMKISSLNLSGWCWWCLLRWYPVLMITTDCPKMLSNTCNMYLVIILHWCDIWAHPVTIELTITAGGTKVRYRYTNSCAMAHVLQGVQMFLSYCHD